ncbi:MAG: FHA domain-containing protein [Methanophagales archaeon]|nr:FHA domain-containing protein [Methanophagales archaeon]
MLLEAFLAAVIHGLLAPEFTKIREEVFKKVKYRIRSQKSFGERALNRPISDFSEKDHEEIRNIVATTLDEYGVSKEIKNTLAESYSTVLSTKSMHVIRIMNGIDEGREYILEVIDVAKDIGIGRCSVSEIRMDENDRTISRHHARLLFENGAYFIEDTWSTNGTRVDGREINGKTRLYDGAKIEIGRAVLLFSERERIITAIDGRGMEIIRLDKIKMREDIRIGRWPVNEICIDERDLTASRHHARLVSEKGKYFIEDICSSNGTFVNGVKIEEKKKLEDKDEIKLGNTLMLMQFRRVNVM